MDQSYGSCAKNQSYYYNEPDACTRTNPMGQCMYITYAWSQAMVLSLSNTKDKLYGNSTCTKGSCVVQRIRATVHRELVHQISGLYKYAQQQFNKWNRLNACTCHNVCECVYHHYQTGLLYMYNHLVCAVYCVLECGHYDDVQVHVCNNASVSQHEHMHVMH